MSMVDPKRQTQGDKDVTELQRAYKEQANKLRAGYFPSKSKKNTSEDKRNILQKVGAEGTKAGGKPGDPEGDGGGGTPASDKCDGCDAGNIGCELGKLSCEFTNSLGGAAPIAILVGALIVFIVVALK